MSSKNCNLTSPCHHKISRWSGVNTPINQLKYYFDRKDEEAREVPVSIEIFVHMPKSEEILPLFKSINQGGFYSLFNNACFVGGKSLIEFALKNNLLEYFEYNKPEFLKRCLAQTDEDEDEIQILLMDKLNSLPKPKDK